MTAEDHLHDAKECNHEEPRAHVCPVCQGTGREYADAGGSSRYCACPDCNGTGLLTPDDPEQEDQSST